MALPFSRESIDFSFSRALIEHLENPLDFAKELHRVAKRGSLSPYLPSFIPNTRFTSRFLQVHATGHRKNLSRFYCSREIFNKWTIFSYLRVFVGVACLNSFFWCTNFKILLVVSVLYPTQPNKVVRFLFFDQKENIAWVC